LFFPFSYILAIDAARDWAHFIGKASLSIAVKRAYTGIFWNNLVLFMKGSLAKCYRYVDSPAVKIFLYDFVLSPGEMRIVPRTALLARTTNVFAFPAFSWGIEFLKKFQQAFSSFHGLKGSQRQAEVFVVLLKFFVFS